jgi:hypothetical protein
MPTMLLPSDPIGDPYASPARVPMSGFSVGSAGRFIIAIAFPVLPPGAQPWPAVSLLGSFQARHTRQNLPGLTRLGCGRRNVWRLCGNGVWGAQARQFSVRHAEGGPAGSTGIGIARPARGHKLTGFQLRVALEIRGGIFVRIVIPYLIFADGEGE